jgi:pimeloyl-ACP methyl ester carboxylesterase
MSQGARVAGALARFAPQRIVRVVLDGAPALLGLADGEHEPEIPLDEFRRLARERPATLRDALARHPLLQLVGPSDEAAAVLRGALARYPAIDLLTAHPPAPPSPSLLQPAAFRQPTLVLNGEHDSAARLRIGRRLVQVLPHAERLVLAGAGHLACLDDANAYSDAIARFQNGYKVPERSHADPHSADARRS